MPRVALGGQQVDGLADAGRLVDRMLLRDRQVHGQMKEGVGAAFLDRVDRLQRAGLVGQVGVVLRVLGDPVGGQGLHRNQRRAVAPFAVGGAEEAPDFELGGGEHGPIVASRAFCGSARGMEYRLLGQGEARGGDAAVAVSRVRYCRGWYRPGSDVDGRLLQGAPPACGARSSVGLPSRPPVLSRSEALESGFSAQVMDAGQWQHPCARLVGDHPSTGL
mmetsp:Transcript_41019/g.113990  ORF Transcript_41019/g.113990 Transcript_41019/m.113990 type:complete len:219 (-) Transcript_41019:72-728(-)